MYIYELLWWVLILPLIHRRVITSKQYRAFSKSQRGRRSHCTRDRNWLRKSRIICPCAPGQKLPQLQEDSRLSSSGTKKATSRRHRSLIGIGSNSQSCRSGSRWPEQMQLNNINWTKQLNKKLTPQKASEQLNSWTFYNWTTTHWTMILLTKFSIEHVIIEQCKRVY